MRTILTLAMKDLRLLSRDRVGFFWWMVGFPLLIATLIGAMFGGVVEGPLQAMPVAIVDEAQSGDARRFVDLLAAGGKVDVVAMGHQDARDAVRRGRLSAMVVLKADFHISPAALWGRPLPLAIGLDPSRGAEAAYVEAALKETAIRLLHAQWADPARRAALLDAWLAELDEAPAWDEGLGRELEPLLATLRDYFAAMVHEEADDLETGPAEVPDPDGKDDGLEAPPTDQARSPGEARPVPDVPATAWEPAPIEVIAIDGERVMPRSGFEVCFPLGMIWGLIGVTAQFATALVRERVGGTLLRLRVAPIERFHLLAGMGVACFAACVGVMVFLLIVGRVAFGVGWENPVVLMMIVPSTAWCFVGLAMVLSVLGRTEPSVTGAAWACLVGMAMLGGGMVPQMFLPAWMDVLGWVSPVKWAILGFEGGIWRGLSAREAWAPCAILLAMGTSSAAAGVVLLARHDR